MRELILPVLGNGRNDVGICRYQPEWTPLDHSDTLCHPWHIDCIHNRSYWWTMPECPQLLQSAFLEWKFDPHFDHIPLP